MLTCFLIGKNKLLQCWLKFQRIMAFKRFNII